MEQTIARREFFDKFLDLARLSILQLRLRIGRPLPAFLIALLQGLDCLANKRRRT